MKRFFYIILMAAMLLSLTSCFRKVSDAPLPYTDTVSVTDSEPAAVETDEETVSETGLPSTEQETLPETERPKAETKPATPADPIISLPREDKPPAPEVNPETEPPFVATPETEPPALPNYYEHMEVDPNRKKYDLGICRKLEGDVDVYLFFMDDDNSRWTPSIASGFTQDEIEPALEHLQYQAKVWGKSLHFNTPISYVTGDGKGYAVKYNGTVIEGGSDSTTTDTLCHAAQCIGYEDDYDMFNHYRAETGRDNVIYLTLFNKDGRDFSMTQHSNKYKMYTEHCVIYTNSSMAQYGGMATMYSSTIAHEILHLYGAYDYYDEPRATIANELYRHDIMLQKNMYYLQMNIVGDYTAFSIGWTDVVPEVCSREDWLD